MESRTSHTATTNLFPLHHLLPSLRSRYPLHPLPLRFHCINPLNSTRLTGNVSPSTTRERTTLSLSLRPQKSRHSTRPMPPAVSPFQHIQQPQQQQQQPSQHPPLQMSLPALHLYPLNDSFVPKQISLHPQQGHVKIGRQTNAKTVPGERNGYFDSKVLSRQHAEIWEENAKVRLTPSVRTPTDSPPHSDLHQRRQVLQRYLHQWGASLRRGNRIRAVRTQDG